MAKDRAEYVEDEAEAGPLAFPSRRPFGSVDPFATSSGGPGLPSCGTSWPPIGVASRNCGAAGRAAGRCGRRVSSGMCAPSSWTGRLLGEGGMPSFSFGGCRGLLLLEVLLLPPLLFAGLLLLRGPGTGGLSIGTGDDISRLFCLSPGRNNSFGSASVASLGECRAVIWGKGKASEMEGLWHRRGSRSERWKWQRQWREEPKHRSLERENTSIQTSV